MDNERVLPASVDAPYGFFEFIVTDVQVGGSVVVELIVPDGSIVDSYYKYGGTPHNPTPHWYQFDYDGTTGAVVDGNVIRLHFIDGQRGDDDLTTNGVIVDPGMLARISHTDPAPTATADVVSVSTDETTSQAHDAADFLDVAEDKSGVETVLIDPATYPIIYPLHHGGQRNWQPDNNPISSASLIATDHAPAYAADFTEDMVARMTVASHTPTCVNRVLTGNGERTSMAALTNKIGSEPGSVVFGGSHCVETSTAIQANGSAANSSAAATGSQSEREGQNTVTAQAAILTEAAPVDKVHAGTHIWRRHLRLCVTVALAAGLAISCVLSRYVTQKRQRQAEGGRIPERA